jgi:hypothetical protein
VDADAVEVVLFDGPSVGRIARIEKVTAEIRAGRRNYRLKGADASGRPHYRWPPGELWDAAVRAVRSALLHPVPDTSGLRVTDTIRAVVERVNGTAAVAAGIPAEARQPGLALDITDGAVIASSRMRQLAEAL